MLDRIIGGSTVLLVIYAVMSTVGLAAYAYDEFGRRLRDRGPTSPSGACNGAPRT
jgi:hypothetical protein